MTEEMVLLHDYGTIALNTVTKWLPLGYGFIDHRRAITRFVHIKHGPKLNSDLSPVAKNSLYAQRYLQMFCIQIFPFFGAFKDTLISET